MSHAPLYTAAELEIIRNGGIPEGRKRHAVLIKANLMGVKIKRIVPNKWTDDEIRLLRENKPVEGRTEKACRSKAYKMGIGYCPTGNSFAVQHERRVKYEEAIIEELKRNGCKLRPAGRKFGVSYTTVSDIANRAGLSHNKSPKELKGASIEWGGSCWTWNERRNQSSYWRETTGKRRNLSRVIYEQANGKIPHGHVVVFRNGDRMDLRAENLECISQEAFIERQRQDPMVAAAMLAGGALGRLNTRIRRETDPEYDKKMKGLHIGNAKTMLAKKNKKGNP